MGREGFEHLLGLHAAPTFAGLKAGSLLSFRRSSFEDLDALLASYEPCFRCKGISVFRLAEGAECVLILFYRERELEKSLKRKEAREILTACGYRGEGSLTEQLEHLRGRVRNGKSFPHEVGLFLDYPPEDVAGFIEHRGRQFVYSGYWKVYSNEAETREMFARYAQCTKNFCSRLDAGARFSDLLEAV